MGPHLSYGLQWGQDMNLQLLSTTVFLAELGGKTRLAIIAFASDARASKPAVSGAVSAALVPGSTIGVSTLLRSPGPHA